MTTRVKIEDIIFVDSEISKLFRNCYNGFNEWETKFLRDVHDLISMSTPLSEKQLLHLYKAYFKHVESDEDALEDWAREHGLLHLMQPRYDKD